MSADQSVQAIKVKLELENLKEIQDQMTKAWTLGNTTRQMNLAQDSSEVTGFFKFYNDVRNRFRGIPGDKTSPNERAGIQMTGEASRASGKIADDIMKVMKTGIGIIEDIHARIRQASPLLQSVESLFNLAVQLFFMPLGNKLATVMLPAIMDLVDAVLALWDKMEGMDLGEMINYMITEGSKIFGQYFQDLGNNLKEQGGILGAIGSILDGMGEFIENKLAWFLQKGVEILDFILKNLGTLVLAFVEFKMLSISLQLAQIAATVAAGTKIGSLTAGVGVLAGAMAIGNTALFSSGIGQDILALNAASGMYVGATDGGRKVTVAEGGEGEFILPESRLQSIMDTVSDRMVDTAQAQPATETKESEPTVINNYYNTFNGYTDNDILDIIRREVSDQIGYARLRAGLN